MNVIKAISMCSRYTADTEQSQDLDVGLGPPTPTRWPGIFLSFRGEYPAPQGISQSWTNHSCGPAPGSPVILPHALHVAREWIVTTRLPLPSALGALPCSTYWVPSASTQPETSLIVPSPSPEPLLHGGAHTQSDCSQCTPLRVHL